ncbi:hypothetical protein BJ508DRAFT_359181 [Ascobolus immersus RN42]|uniref:Uncharacterized protein n=1 Tax=Ascobolus immersus RN42 TaxID=1160509 RepID=A0A3N4IK74_ASCIM|nr:hypothetical protein BJ508DRAFT_359181 [Ascobolus immersus RN42]
MPMRRIFEIPAVQKSLTTSFSKRRRHHTNETKRPIIIRGACLQNRHQTPAASIGLRNIRATSVPFIYSFLEPRFCGSQTEPLIGHFLAKHATFVSSRGPVIPSTQPLVESLDNYQYPYDVRSSVLVQTPMCKRSIGVLLATFLHHHSTISLIQGYLRRPTGCPKGGYKYNYIMLQGRSPLVWK